MKGILFTEPMFLAATRKETEGSAPPKTQTRRIESGLENINLFPNNWTVEPYYNGSFFVRSQDGQSMGEIKPRYQKGDVVYLKEPFAIQEFSRYMLTAKVNYRYGGNEHCLINISEKTAGALSRWKTPLNRWVSPMMMFEEFSRYQIDITNVRCERLQSISEQDCIAEGVEQKANSPYTHPSWRDYRDSKVHELSAKKSYHTLIETIHGKDVWYKNPWIFIYEFKLSDL